MPPLFLRAFTVIALNVPEEFVWSFTMNVFTAPLSRAFRLGVSTEKALYILFADGVELKAKETPAGTGSQP